MLHPGDYVDIVPDDFSSERSSSSRGRSSVPVLSAPSSNPHWESARVAVVSAREIILQRLAAKYFGFT